MFTLHSGANDFNLDSIDIVSYCPLCESRRENLTTEILAESSAARLVHTHCENCESFIVSLVLTSSIGVSSIGLVSDLTGEDVIRFKDMPVITYDDALEFYQTVNKSIPRDFDRPQPGVQAQGGKIKKL